MSEQPACAHLIVAHTTVTASDGFKLMDAWACCDCGARFSRDLTLPTFMPEPSHLHGKLDALRAQLAAVTRERDELKAHLVRVIGWHNAPSDCYSTGPVTGTALDDVCPSCEALRMLAKRTAPSAGESREG
jgi:hypothetical protein